MLLGLWIRVSTLLMGAALVASRASGLWVACSPVGLLGLASVHRFTLPPIWLLVLASFLCLAALLVESHRASSS